MAAATKWCGVFAIGLGLAFVVGVVNAAELPAPQPADDLETLQGFRTDMLLKADPKREGSWICLAKDNKGRLLLAGQNRQPITRVTVEDGRITKEELLHLPVSEAMGMLYAFDSLYVDGNDGKHFGLFRLRDTKGDGNYDSVELLRPWDGGSGEHGAHAIVVGPDQKLYVVCGNFVQLPADLDPNSPVRNYADDQVLPRAEDGNGFGAGNKPPGGHVIRMDPDGKNASLVAAGERNTYAIAFNPDGELFGFDSDMEWDWGTPWYRPIRFFHAPLGADQGFREGSAKWPEYYPDSLPAIAAVGVGSPTGVTFGAGAKFPAKYQKAMYANDWTYGRLIALHLKPDGASYGGEWENLVAPKGLHGPRKTNLNLTGIVVGDDGALYFTTGGRSLEAKLYRVSYTGPASTAPADLHDADGAKAREERHKLEAWQSKKDPAAIDAAWAYLGNPDRFLRYAARLAIENQPVEQWKQRALSERQPEAAINALLALARYGGSESQKDLLTALARFPIASLDKRQQLEKLRVIEVSLSRDGKPTADTAAQLIAELDPAYPASQDETLNRELCQTLLALGAHDAVAKTMQLLAAAPTQEEQVGYICYLRTVKTGWTPELRRQYFAWFTKDYKHGKHDPGVIKWFTDAGRDYDNGASFDHFIEHFHDDAERTLSDQEKLALAPVLDAYVSPDQRQHQAKVRPFVKEWTMADVEPSLDEVGHGRDYARAKATFEGMQCLSCHKFGSEGGAVGPDLTAIASRYSRKDVLAKILDPSRAVSEQYANTALKLADGESVVGRVIDETPDTIVLRPNPLAPERIEVKKSDIKSRGFSKTSPMPEGLLNSLQKDEILDLLAYLDSGGRADHPDFKK